jgi:hypothetical protein
MSKENNGRVQAHGEPAQLADKCPHLSTLILIASKEIRHSVKDDATCIVLPRGGFYFGK